MFRTIYCGIIMLALLLAVTACDNSPAESELPTAIATFTAAPNAAPVAATAVSAVVVDTPVATTPLTMTSVATVTAITVSTATTQVAITVTHTPTLAPTAEPTQSPTLTPTPIPTVTQTPTPTDAAAAAPTSTSSPATAAVVTTGNLPPAIADLLLNADVAAGQQVTVLRGCTVCHSLEKDVRIVGPSWYSVGATAGARVPGQSAEFYLYNSILHPNDFIVPDYQPNLMPGNFGELLTEQDFANMISYLLTLKGQ